MKRLPLINPMPRLRCFALVFAIVAVGGGALVAGPSRESFPLAMLTQDADQESEIEAPDDLERVAFLSRGAALPIRQETIGPMDAVRPIGTASYFGRPSPRGPPLGIDG